MTHLRAPGVPKPTEDHLGPVEDEPRLCGEDCATEREMAYYHGRDEERAAVVKWLRRYAAAQHSLTLTVVATYVERGEHQSHECRGEPCATEVELAEVAGSVAERDAVVALLRETLATIERGEHR